MFPEPAEDLLHIVRRGGLDDAELGGWDVCLPGAEHRLDDIVADLPLSCAGERLPNRERALMRSEFLGIHLPGLRSAIDHVERVHGAVPDVADQIDALHAGGKFRNGGVALRIDFHADDADFVFRAAKHERDLFVPGEVGSEGILLPAGPCQRQTGGEKHVCFGQPGVLQLHGNGGKGENVIILVLDLLGKEFFVPLSDQMVPTCVDQQVVCERRLLVLFEDAGGEAVVCGLDVAVTVIDPDDCDSLDGFHGVSSP